jgi:hypothetical protein
MMVGRREGVRGVAISLSVWKRSSSGSSGSSRCVCVCVCENQCMKEEEEEGGGEGGREGGRGEEQTCVSKARHGRERKPFSIIYSILFN